MNKLMEALVATSLGIPIQTPRLSLSCCVHAAAVQYMFGLSKQALLVLCSIMMHTHNNGCVRSSNPHCGNLAQLCIGVITSCSVISVSLQVLGCMHFSFVSRLLPDSLLFTGRY